MNKQNGFTLIEIVMVLVLLGILGAVAVPKYFDMQENAEAKAAQAIGAEYQARMNGAFAKKLLEGSNCSTARTTALAELPADGTTLIDERYYVTKGTVGDTGAVDLTIKFKNGVVTAGHVYKAIVPVCATN